MPTRLNPDFNRSVARLDLSPAHSGIFTPGMEAIEIHDEQVHRFNVLAQSLSKEMPALSADQFAGVARRVLRTAVAGGESPFIRSRLRRAEEMRAMYTDAAWPLDPISTRRIDDLLAYIDDPDGLIHDDVPYVGKLDDALLVDIALDALREELDDYAEFCRYRSAEESRIGTDPESACIDRTSWQEARDNELRLEQQLRRVRGSHYEGANAAERLFRVC